jgi:nucleotide sugar dehydrogenase
MKIVVLGGLGHIGLVLSLKLASQGHEIIIVDPSKKATKLFARNLAVFDEKNVERKILENKDSIKLFSDIESCAKQIEEADFVVVATSNDDLAFSVLRDFKNYSYDGLFLIRQTIKLGTLKNLKSLGFNVAYIPERLVQGNGFEEIDKLPQIVGVENNEHFEKIAKLFDWVECIKVSYEEAELCKLFCNYFRYGVFALANDMFLRASLVGADFTKIREAIMKDYPRMKNFPKAGFAGGYCLGKDTRHLINSIEKKADFLAKAVDTVNDIEFVLYIKRKIISQIKTGKKVGILGVTAKLNNDDLRESVFSKIVTDLDKKYPDNILWHDPFLSSKNSVGEILRECKVIFIGMPHDTYNFLKFGQYLEDKTVIDTWGFVEKGDY